MTRVLWLAVLVCAVQCLPMSQDELEDFSNFLLKTSSLDIHVKSADPDDSFDEDEVVSDHAWEESGKFEGDLILNDRQRRLIVENVEGLSRNGLTDSTKRWPNNELIYFIQREHFTSGQVQAIQDGIEDLARASCVKFRPYRKGDRDAVVIQGSRRGCFSQVGYQGGYQVLNLSGRHPVGRGCFRHGTVIHELLHSLGFYHMQSSPDRDDYIDVIWANIVQPARHNFRKYNSFSVSDFGVGYDYDSVLHYSRRAFSANGQDTLVPKKSGAQIGQRAGLSDKDTQKLNKMYCDADSDPAVQADENTSKKPKNKKKKPRNQPFQGHGIGYHQGKTVVIKLPAAETYKLANVPSTHVFDFSKTPQVVPSEAEGYRFGGDITYSYNPVSLSPVRSKDYNKPEVEIVSKHKEKVTDTVVKHPKQDIDGHSISQNFNDLNEVKPERVPIEDDKDLHEAFHKFTNIVKQPTYPQNENYDHKIDKDYSNFYRQSDPHHDSLEEKFDQLLSNGPSTTLKEKTDITNPTLTHKKLEDNRQLIDRMDISYRTSLPTKKPYDSYEQTETPYYATLEYLRDRHDFSDIYDLKYPYDNERKDERILIAGHKYKDDIKINPYDQGFYTDFVKNDKQRATNDSTLIQENKSKEVEPSKYQVEEFSKDEQLKQRVDSSYRTFIPTSKPYSAYDHTETPKYATLEYLKDRHDISAIYPPRKSNRENRDKKEPYIVLEENPPTENDWYTKDSYKYNPANYDIDSYSDYSRQKQNDQDNDRSDEYRDSNKGDENDNGSLSITKETKPGSKARVGYPYYEKEDNGKLTLKNQKEENDDDSTEAPIDDNVKNNKSSYNRSIHTPALYNQNNLTNYDYGSAAGSEETSSNEGSKESPKKSQPYSLYGVPVPLTKDWYKISYIIPKVSQYSDDNTSRVSKS